MQSERPSKCTFNPRTYSRIHTPTVVLKGGWWWNLSLEFLICCSISKRFCLQWKTFDLLNKMRYILWLVALLEACDVTNNGYHLGFYQELKIRLKPQEIFTFNVENRKAFCMCMCLCRSSKGAFSVNCLCSLPAFAGCFLEMNDVYWELRSTNVFLKVSRYFYDESEFMAAALSPLRGKSFLSAPL